MSSKVKIDLDFGNMRRLLRSKAMKDMLMNEAEGIALKCGEGYEAKAKLMPSREIAIVEAETNAARRDNLENNTILKAVGK